MKAKLFFATILLILCFTNVWARSTPDDDGALRDPTPASRKFKSGVEVLAANREAWRNARRQVGQKQRQSLVKANLFDPTQMSGNFRAALERLKFRTTTTELNSTGKLPPFPKVSLAAIVYSEDQEAYSMLHIDKKTVLVRVGDKASFVDNDTVIDVVVQEINRNDVRLAVYPANEIIILR